MLRRSRYLVLLVVLAVGVAAFVAPAGGTPPQPKLTKQAKETLCKNGGYRSFGFRNQGECVALVERIFKDRGGGYAGLRSAAGTR